MKIMQCQFHTQIFQITQEKKNLKEVLFSDIKPIKIKFIQTTAKNK